MYSSRVLSADTVLVRHLTRYTLALLKHTHTSILFYSVTCFQMDSSCVFVLLYIVYLCCLLLLAVEHQTEFHCITLTIKTSSFFADDIIHGCCQSGTHKPIFLGNNKNNKNVFERIEMLSTLVLCLYRSADTPMCQYIIYYIVYSDLCSRPLRNQK